jgi:outer membrane protein TolC
MIARTKCWLAALLLAGFAVPAGRAPADPPPPEAPVLTAERAVAWALQYSPELAVVRRQRGLAEANVVIAHTYPFNPVWQNFTLAAGGPASADIKNRVFQENTVRLDLELRGQGKIRAAVAAAALSRTEWEIAAQELIVAVRTLRAFNTFVYRQEKLSLLEDTIRVQEQTVQKAKLLAEQGKVKPADFMLANSDLVEIRAQRGPGQSLVVAAWNDVRRAMGVDQPIAGYQGRLEPVALSEDADGLAQRALQSRPDLKALQLAAVEADQRVHLEVANRYGNPSIGPGMEYNETRIYFLGVWLVTPLPILNTKRGDLLLRQAERDKVIEDKRRVEVQAVLDVRAAVDRIRQARKWVDYFGSESLPALQKTMEAFEKLFEQGEPGVDILRLIDTRRRLVRARDSYLDALWELSQARADLAAAVGDLTLVVGPAECAAPTPLNRPQLLPPVPN